jgi:hypothetical protein
MQGGGAFCINPFSMAELNLWIDSYDDIYSDFDSRHFLKRRISEDFLFELRTEIKYKEGHAGDMVLLLPQERRDESAEKIIANSLIDFLFYDFAELKKERNFYKQLN